MIYLGFIFLAIILAIISYAYIENFIPNLIQEVYLNFQEVFPQHRGLLTKQQKLQSSYVKKKDFFPLYGYQLFFIMVVLIFFYLSHSVLVTFWFSLFFSITLTIAILDHLYHLISVSLCQMTWMLILIGDYWKILPFSIEQSVIHSIVGFLCFYFLYYVSAWIYRKEALGRGDYWLAFGLSGCFYLQQLSIFIFMASFFALIYYFIYFYFFYKLKEIPFAPFLVISAYLLLFFNLLII